MKRVFGLLLGLGPIWQSAATEHGITMRVLNPAMVPGKTLLRAEGVAAAILNPAGVEVTWLDCDSATHPCRQYPTPKEFWLHLLKNSPPRLRGDATGFAVLMPQRDGAVSYAGVSYPAVEEVASGLEADVSDVLGATMAHEIGHILLGSQAHSRSGVMSSRLQKAEVRMAGRGELRFTAEQAERIRLHLVLVLASSRIRRPREGLKTPHEQNRVR